MAIKDIQARLDAKVEEQAEKDFKEAIVKAHKLLAPFFEAIKCTEYRTNTELDEMQKAFAKATRINNYGTLYLAADMKVPSCYIRMKQAEASKAFIEAVDCLQTQLDDLQGQVDYLAESN